MNMEQNMCDESRYDMKHTQICGLENLGWVMVELILGQKMKT